MNTQIEDAITIRDLNGFLQEIDDLDAAIAVAAEYMEWHHNNKAFTEFDKKQKDYWSDLHEKLSTLKNKRRNGNRKKSKCS